LPELRRRHAGHVVTSYSQLKGLQDRQLIDYKKTSEQRLASAVRADERVVEAYLGKQG